MSTAIPEPERTRFLEAARAWLLLVEGHELKAAKAREEGRDSESGQQYREPAEVLAKATVAALAQCPGLQAIRYRGWVFRVSGNQLLVESEAKRPSDATLRVETIED